MILMDTGPLVALFDPRDADHRHCHTLLAQISEPLFTSEAVLTEVFHMLNPGSRGAEGVKEFFLQGYLGHVPMDKALLQRCFELMDKYADLPMDFADASLLALAEKFRTTKVFTLDFEDFQIYKIKKGYRHYPLQLIGH